MTNLKGRPKDMNRQTAKLLGERTYHGKACKRCRGTERYTIGSSCVVCQRAKVAEGAQLLRAARAGTLHIDFETRHQNLDFLDRPVVAVKAENEAIDFLDLVPDRPYTHPAHVLHTTSDQKSSNKKKRLRTPTRLHTSPPTFIDGNTSNVSPEGIEDFGVQACSPSEVIDDKQKNPDQMTCVGRVQACSPNKTKPEPDPEPLCPQCGCGTDAEFVERDGWLRRVTPWRCTICDWVDSVPPESLDSLDFLG